MTYLILKYTHILSATILFGTGIGSAFYMFITNRRRDIHGIVFATRHVVIADAVLTAPAVIVQLVTGIAMIMVAKHNWGHAWILWGITLFFFIGLCWLPVVWIQIKMRDIAKRALEQNKALPELYWKYERIWIILGCLAFAAMLIVFYLMVFKPV